MRHSTQTVNGFLSLPLSNLSMIASTMTTSPATSSRASLLRPRTELVPKDVPLVERVAFVLFWSLLCLYTTVILTGDILIMPSEELKWCRVSGQSYRRYPNPDSPRNPCYYERTLYLLGLNPFECDFSRRMIISVLFGAAIGYERKAADRPAGIRTMSLVCLGAAVFSMCSQFAFRSSTMTWDAARVSAAIPSGVGFLGSALIWQSSGGERGQSVHGLTTAASVWLSASVGIGVGGGLYVVSAWAVVLVVIVLRLGPRMYLQDDSSSFADHNISDWETGDECVGGDGSEVDDDDDDDDGDGREPLTREQQLQLLRENTTASIRSNLTEGGFVEKQTLLQSLRLAARKKRQKPAVIFHS